MFVFSVPLTAALSRSALDFQSPVDVDAVAAAAGLLETRAPSNHLDKNWALANLTLGKKWRVIYSRNLLQLSVFDLCGHFRR